MKLLLFEVHAVASSVEEAKKLVEAGFEYVCGYENRYAFQRTEIERDPKRALLPNVVAVCLIWLVVVCFLCLVPHLLGQRSGYPGLCGSAHHPL